MTKEELEKEADDYVMNTATDICEFEGIVTCICDGEGNAINVDGIAKSAYLAGAESREKKMAELKWFLKKAISLLGDCKQHLGLYDEPELIHAIQKFVDKTSFIIIEDNEKIYQNEVFAKVKEDNK